MYMVFGHPSHHQKNKSNRFTILQYINPIKSLWLTFLPRGLVVYNLSLTLAALAHVMWFHECLIFRSPQSRIQMAIPEIWPQIDGNFHTQWNPKGDNFKIFFLQLARSTSICLRIVPHILLNQGIPTRHAAQTLGAIIVVGRLAAHAL